MRKNSAEASHDFAEDWELIRRKDPKSYVGRRTKSGRCVVKVVEGSNSKRLNLARNIRQHSNGFEWGYAGSGPAQLALAILYDLFQDRKRAQRLYQDFKAMVVIGLPKEGWELPELVVREAVKTLEKAEK